MRPIVTNRVVWTVGRSVTEVSPAKMTEPIEMPFGLRTQSVRWAQETIIRLGSQMPPWKRQFWRGKWQPIVKNRDFLPWALQKWQNRLICYFDCGLGWAEGNTSSIVFARWHKCTRWHCRELRKNGWTNWLVVWVVDLCGPKEAEVQSYLPGGANVPTWKCTSAHWRHLENTTEPSICVGDVVLCQITLITTCSLWHASCHLLFHVLSFI